MKQPLQTTSSNPNYFIATGSTDEERLRLVNEIYNSKTFKFLIAKGLKPGMRVLEIGCGYGHSAIWMAQQVTNSGRVCAVDYSADTLEIARKNAESKGVNNIDFVRFDVSKIGELGKKFDFIYGRWIIEFCQAKPDKILRDLYELLNPGGIFTHETGSFSNSGIVGNPESQVVDRWRELCLANATRSGNELDMASRFPTDLKTIGYKDIYFERHHPTLRTPEHKSVLRLALESVRKGVIANQTLGIDDTAMDKFISECRQLEQDSTQTPSFFNVILISAVKPTAATFISKL